MASKTSRARQLEEQERARTEAFDKAMRVMGREVAAKAAAFTPPKPPQDPQITALARAMADPDYHLPTSAIASTAFDDDDELVVTGLTIQGRFWSIEHIVKLGLINERGAWLWSRWSAINMALPPVTDEIRRPHFAATVAGRPSL